jgi:hypothetical protein
MDPLIATVEQQAAELFAEHPNVPVDSIGHSMGGLLWLEVLHRNPAWWQRMRSLTLVASPVAGADLARTFDPYAWGVMVARDLARDRRFLAEAVADGVPTLVIAGQNDVVVPPRETYVAGTTHVILPGLAHDTIRDHSMTAHVIKHFWQSRLDTNATDHSIDLLRGVPAIMPTHHRDIPQARVVALLSDGGTVRTWTNPLGFAHAFVIDRQGNARFGGFVWPHQRHPLDDIVEQICAQFGNIFSTQFLLKCSTGLSVRRG